MIVILRPRVVYGVLAGGTVVEMPSELASLLGASLVGGVPVMRLVWDKVTVPDEPPGHQG